MKTTKFSHKYEKLKVLGNQKNARLLEVLEVKTQDLHESFLNYDTDFGKFLLPKAGEFLLLIFNSSEGLFTTIRRSTPEKKEYYKNARGELFIIEIAK